MPIFNIGDYGVLGGVILLFVIVFWKAPEIVNSFKGQQRTTTTEVSNSNGSTNSNNNNLVLQELTVAITKLTVFLETEKAVDKEKEQVMTRSIDSILEGITELRRVQADHVLKCDINCKFVTNNNR